MVDLRVPFDKEELLKLRVGDKVSISGEILTARDKAHQKMLRYMEEDKELPFNLDGRVIYHCGPLLESSRVLSAGPTTSARMNQPTVELVDNVDCIAIAGKGGMSREVAQAMKGKGIYLAVTGGTGALTAQWIKEVKDCYWEELGMAEAVWVFEVEDFQCMVGIDSQGRSIYDEVSHGARKALEKLKD